MFMGTYLGNAKSWFLKSHHVVHFLLYENLPFSQKWKKKLLYQIEFPAFSQKDNMGDFKNHDFALVPKCP